jgi:serine O-acetyltransferase
MKIINLERERLAIYIKTQITHLIPLDSSEEFGLIDKYLPESLSRLGHCIDQIRMWEPGQFDILHSSQYCTFLYYLANTIWRREQARNICTRLFLLNKALNGIDCFYEIELPEGFFIGHSVGIVLAKATYGNHLVLYQNSTVGKNHGEAPVLEDNVILYPNSAIIGKCLVKSGTVVGQGVSVINQNTEKNKIVFQGAGGSLIFKEPRRNICADFFRNMV